MSIPIVIDEWLFDDLLGTNGDEKQEETFYFITKLVKICDRIVILEGSPFETKMRSFMESSKKSSNPELKGIGKYLIEAVLTNSLKKVWLSHDCVQPFPKNLESFVSRKDHYLFQAYFKLKNKGSFIVTTDGRWNHKKLKNKSIKIEMRDQFVKTYLKKQIKNVKN